MTRALDPRLLARNMSEADIVAVSEAYDTPEHLVRTMSDLDLCYLIGCELDELSFYLFDTEEYDKIFGDTTDDDGFDQDGSFDFDAWDDALVALTEKTVLNPKPTPEPTPLSVYGGSSKAYPNPRFSPANSHKRAVPHHYEIVR